MALECRVAEYAREIDRKVFFERSLPPRIHQIREREQGRGVVAGDDQLGSRVLSHFPGIPPGVDPKSQQDAGDDNDTFGKQAYSGDCSAIGFGHTRGIQRRRRSPASPGPGKELRLRFPGAPPSEALLFTIQALQA